MMFIGTKIKRAVIFTIRRIPGILSVKIRLCKRKSPARKLTGLLLI
jgi:hypothetical protein